jgi:uncharacterized protein YjbI with pentapeptide repeats
MYNPNKAIRDKVFPVKIGKFYGAPTKANLGKANLRVVDFRGASLSGVNLRNEDLRGAIL